MKKLRNDNSGFSAVEVILVIAVVILIGVVGWLVYKDHHKTTTADTTTTSATKPATSTKTTTSTPATPVQQYVTISAWGVRVPYPSGDTLSVSSQTCTENGDAAGDTVNLGCQVTVNSQDLANSVGSCTAKISGTVGYFYTSQERRG